ncbi:MAG: class I SAM-dependent methyltransferase [Ignavibacteriales bacterium]|nr:class I SAM-dependent methyltransferase [Ignavibacteriales bacterium]
MKTMRTTHSVEEHLHLQAAEYDRIIRTFIPRYDEMLQEIVKWLRIVLPSNGKVIDLGGGTGSLAYEVARHFPSGHIEIRDTDPKMLGIARQRFSGIKHKVSLLEKSFYEPLPRCDAVVATLALHHVHELRKKTALYRNIYAALGAPGIFLNGDCTTSRSKTIQKEEYRIWSDFMKGHGMNDEEVQKHFAEWEGEDTYFSLSEELSALRSAGFPEPECYWKYGPMAIYGGVKQ